MITQESCVARHVHALPETRRRKEHRVRRVRKRSSSTERGAVPCSSSGNFTRARHALVHIVHLRVAGEKAKRAALAKFPAARAISSAARRGKRRRRARRACFGGMYSSACSRKSNSGGSTLSFAGCSPSRCFRIIESPAHRQRRRSQHHRIELLEQLFAQNLAHVDRRRRQKHALAAPLVPVDVIFFVRSRAETSARAAIPPRAARCVTTSSGFGVQRRNLRLHALHRRRQLVVSLAILLQKRLPLGRLERKAPFARRKSSKNVARSLAHPLQSRAQQRRRPDLQSAAASAPRRAPARRSGSSKSAARNNRWPHPRFRALRRKPPRNIPAESLPKSSCRIARSAKNR